MTEPQTTVTTETNTVTDPNVNTASTEEVTPVVPVPEPVKEDKTSARFAALARQERKLQEQKRELHQKSVKVSEYERIQALAKEDPLKYIEQLTGSKFEDVLNKFIGLDASKAQENEPEAKIKRLEERVAAAEKAEQDRVANLSKQQNEAEWKNHIAAVSKYINDENKKDSKQYEVIMAHSGRALSVYQQLLNDTVEAAGRPLDNEEVIAILNRTEEVLATELKPLVEKLKKTSRFSDTKTEPEKVIQTETKKQTTLTNDLSTSSPVVQRKMNSRDAHQEEVARKYQAMLNNKS